MAKFRYYIAPTFFETTGTTLIIPNAESAIIDLGVKVEGRENQIYNVAHGIRYAPTEYFSQCREVTLEKFKGIIYGEEIFQGFLFPEFILAEIKEVRGDVCVYVYNQAPYSITEASKPYARIISKRGLQQLATLNGFDSFETLKFMVGFNELIYMELGEFEKRVTDLVRLD